MPEKTTCAEDAKKGHKDSIAKFKGKPSSGKRALFSAVLCSMVALSPLITKSAFAQAPRESDKAADARQAAMPTPAIGYFDSLNRDGTSRFSPAFRGVVAKICRLASENRPNEIFTISLEMLLDAVVRRSSEDISDSLGVTGNKFAIGNENGTEHGLIQLSPLGDDGAQFRITLDGDTAVFQITPESKYEDVAELNKRIFSLFNTIVNIYGLYPKVRPSPPPPPPSTANLQEPMG
jgi:hypothetical protein